MILHGFCRSSTSFRARIALNLKGLEHQHRTWSLRDGEQRSGAYLTLNRQGLVPTLELDDGTRLTQSFSIIEYLEENYPEPPLLPADSLERARVREIAYAIGCDIHPLGNLRVLNYLGHALDVDQEGKTAWAAHWIAVEFDALEGRLAAEAATGEFCHGGAPTLADVCLVPQVFNALRFGVDMTKFPEISRIHENCMALQAFDAAQPSKQPDFA